MIETAAAVTLGIILGISAMMMTSDKVCTGHSWDEERELVEREARIEEPGSSARPRYRVDRKVTKRCDDCGRKSVRWEPWFYMNKQGTQMDKSGQEIDTRAGEVLL